MSTIEKQWLQIFERQRWVINQAKQQAFLFDQDLASKLIIAGITPPPSLFSSDPDVLNHHELISEVPFPHARRVIPFTDTGFYGFEKSVATAHYRQVKNGLCAEHCGVNKGSDVGGNVLGDLPQCPLSNGGCASNGVPQDHQEEDPSVTSPEDERNARVSDAYHDSTLQLARGAGEEISALPQDHNTDAGGASVDVLQDQREEISGDTSPEGQRDAKMVFPRNISDGGCASNGVTQDRREEDPSVTSPEDERDARVTDVYHDSASTPARGTGQGVSNLPLCHISDAGYTFDGVIRDHREKNPGGTSPEGQRDIKKVCVPKISNGGCASNGVTQDHGEEDPSATCPEDERGASVADVYHDSALTPARGAGQWVSSLPECHISDAGCAFDGVIQDHKEENLGGTSPKDQRDARMLDIYLDPALSLARVQRSKSRQRALAIRNSAQKSGSQDNDNVDCYAGETIKFLISTPQSENVDKLHENHVMEKPKIGEFQSKEKGSRIYSGRVTRSRSSGHQENSLNVSSSLCIRKTSGGITVDSIGKSMQLSNHVIHPLEFVSYSHVTNDRCREEESLFGDCLSKEKLTVEKDSANLEREEHTPKALQEVTGQSVSKDDAGNSIICRSPSEETHLNVDHHMVETSGSSPEAQRKEGGIGWGGVDTSPNAPFTSLHEEKEPSLSSMIKQPTGHAHDSLLEEAGVAHPTIINIDGGSHCLMENPVALIQDNLRIEATEDFSFVGKTLQAKRFESGGLSKFSELSGSAPHVRSSQSETVVEYNDNHSKVAEQKIGEFQMKEEGTDMYSGRITRSKSPSYQENSLIASGSACICRTSYGIAVDINTLEQSCSKGLSTLASKKAIPGSSSVKMPLSFMHVEKELEDGMVITAHVNCNSPLEMNFHGNCEVSAKEMEVQSSLVEAIEGEFSESRRSSNDNVISSVKEPCDAYMDAVANTLLESGKSPKHLGWDGLVHSPVKEVSGSNDAKRTELVSEECAMDSKALCYPHKSTDGDYGMVSGPGSHRILDAENLEVENPSAASRNELRSILAQSIVSAHISPGYFQSAGDEKEVGCSEPTECQTAENSKGRNICYSMDGTSPHKRRKIEDKRVHDLSTSVVLGDDVIDDVKKDFMCANLEREEHSPTTLQLVQGHSISREDSGKLIDSRGHAEERYQNKDNMVERSASLCQAQKKEAGVRLEGVDISPNAPFTFLHEEKEASVFSRLIMQAAGDPQDSLLEEAGVALPTSINIDGGSHCLKEDPCCLPLQDDLGLENADDVSCAGRTMLAKRFDFGGTSNFTQLSGGAPHVTSLDLSHLTSADDAMPVLEGFVIRTDDDPDSIAEEGISFDEWNLPNTAVERASILEQLCKSACMQTPIAYSSASYKLHKVQNVQRSIPTGVVEHVDLKTTLPINDNVKQLKDGNSCWTEEVGPAFYGRSYSDCLPNFSGQSGWDINKPYSSPLGKFWDRIASSSSSSGKRVSSIPELACISEENENEVADKLDGTVSEVLDCSPKRPPLADITEIPNLPDSVSKAVPYTDRFSLDSVTTEFSLTGTHKSVKKKPGIQNSTRRRYNNKENQSVSRGTKDIRRATGSLQDRYSKPKLSEKTILRKGGPSLAELEPKRNNIVSNITSFIPLVQQKQAAAALPGKRDIKVKSLEAAEAAKRLAERKDNERKMKKEAMKVERARVEQENMKKLELQRKRKEEERKKIEADMAAKKRQREEEEKKEKQRKRMRVEEGRREQREHEEKLRAEKVKKELKHQASDGRGGKNKESKYYVHEKMDEEMEHDTLRSISETDPRNSCVSANNTRRGTAAPEECDKGFSNFEHKEEADLDKPTENEKWVAKTSREQSYDISPYKESDDEDEEDDDSIPNNKFIPSWASKNCLALVASGQSVTDLEVIFHPERSPCISEVLLPRKYQLQ